MADFEELTIDEIPQIIFMRTEQPGDFGPFLSAGRDMDEIEQRTEFVAVEHDGVGTPGIVIGGEIVGDVEWIDTRIAGAQRNAMRARRPIELHPMTPRDALRKRGAIVLKRLPALPERVKNILREVRSVRLLRVVGELSCHKK